MNNRYKPEGTALVEMVCSLILSIASFLPWIEMKAEIMGTTVTKTMTMFENGEGTPAVYIMLTLCAINFIVKFFCRSLWLSLLATLMPIGFVVEINESIKRVAEETMGIGGMQFAFGGVLTIVATAVMLISMIVGSVQHIQATVTNSPRGKYKHRFIMAGIGLLVLVGMSFMLTHLLTPTTINVPNEEEIYRSMMCIGLGVAGLLMFLYNLLIALMILSYHRGEKNSDVPTADMQPATTEPHFTDNEDLAVADRRRWYYIAAAVAAVLLISGLVWWGKPKPAGNNSNEVSEEVVDSVAQDAAEDGKVTDYKVENNTVYGKIGDEWISTAVTSEYNSLLIDQKHDLDSDGNMEAIVYESDEREQGRPFIVYYDKENSTFNKTVSLEFNSMPTLQDQSNGGTQLIQREGIRWMVYSFRDGNLKCIEDHMKDLGRVRTTLRMDDFFGKDDMGDHTISLDVDGDDIDESVVLHRDESHAGGYGSYMSISIIRWQDGREVGSPNTNVVSGATIKILAASHNGMPDLVADNYLKRWNGDEYESFEWDGKKLKSAY